MNLTSKTLPTITPTVPVPDEAGPLRTFAYVTPDGTTQPVEAHRMYVTCGGGLAFLAGPVPYYTVAAGEYTYAKRTDSPQSPELADAEHMIMLTDGTVVKRSGVVLVVGGALRINKATARSAHEVIAPGKWRRMTITKLPAILDKDAFLVEGNPESVN